MRLSLRLATALVVFGALSTLRAQPQAFESAWLSRPRQPIVGSHAAARVSVVTYLDWQCPSCRVAERAYAPVFADFARRLPGAVSVETRDYPLNSTCNPYVPISLHPAGCEAAVAVRLARARGTAPAMIDWLFAKQESLTPGSVRDAAAAVGKVADFATRYENVLREVAVDVADAHRFGVTSTPTYFINGILARGDNGRLFSAEEMRRAIEIELARK